MKVTIEWGGREPPTTCEARRDERGRIIFRFERRWRVCVPRGDGLFATIDGRTYRTTMTGEAKS